MPDVLPPTADLPVATASPNVVALLLADKRSAETKRAYAADITRFFATFGTEAPPMRCASSLLSPRPKSLCC